MAEPTPDVRSETQERTPKRVFVEMGTHNMPVSWLGERTFDSDDLYIGVDLDPEMVRTGKEMTEVERRAEGKSSDNMLFVQSDAGRMPIRDHAAEEVFLGNVLGDPSIPDSSKDHFIGEARRIVSDGGTVIIKENNTPAEVEFVRGLLKKHGLKVQRVVDSRSPEWPDAVRPFHSASARQDTTRFKITDYIIFATPETSK